MYTDPTGHVESVDVNLSATDQATILEYTENYYTAKTEEEKDYWHQQAVKIRQAANSGISNYVDEYNYNADHTSATSDDWGEMVSSALSIPDAVPDSIIGGVNAVIRKRTNVVTTVHTIPGTTYTYNTNSYTYNKSLPGMPQGTVYIGKNDATYNLEEPWKNGMSGFDAAARRDIYGVGNDNDFADGLYEVLPKSIQIKIDDWVNKNKNKKLATTNPNLYNTLYADTVLNFYDANKEYMDLHQAISDASSNNDPWTLLAVCVVFGGVNGNSKPQKHTARNVKDIDAMTDIDNFLGKGIQINKNPFSGKTEPDRIFSLQPDGAYRSVRIGDHETRSPKNQHYHLEEWDSNGKLISPDQSVHINNTNKRK